MPLEPQEALYACSMDKQACSKAQQRDCHSHVTQKEALPSQKAPDHFSPIKMQHSSCRSSCRSSRASSPLAIPRGRTTHTCINPIVRTLKKKKRVSGLHTPPPKSSCGRMDISDWFGTTTIPWGLMRGRARTQPLTKMQEAEQTHSCPASRRSVYLFSLGDHGPPTTYKRPPSGI
jgi:hypothetical protein